MSDLEPRNIRFEALRVPIDRTVDLRFEPTEAPERLKAANISMSGMFVRSGKMYAPGTVCALSVELRDDQPPIRGTAEVLWRRERDQGPDRPKGIGIRFLDLDLESKYAISRLVEQYVRLVEMPFHLSGATNNSSASTTALTPSRIMIFIFLAFLSGLTLGSMGSLRWIRAADDAIVTPGITAGSPRAFTHRPTTPAASSNTQARFTTTQGDATAAVASSVKAWARAWSEKDVEGYLACYSESFEPGSGVSLDSWRAQRRDRLRRPGFIEVEISSLEVEPLGSDRAIARFEQTFASPNYRDRVTKTLELVWEELTWKVAREDIVQELAD